MRLSARSSSTTWRIGIVFQDGNRSPQSSRGRPNWLNPATASTSPVVGPEAEVVAGGARRPSRGGRRADATGAVAPAVGAVDPVVEAPGQAVDAELLVPLAEPGQHHATLVGDAVAVGVLEEQDVGSGGDQHAAVPGEHAVGEVRAPRRRPWRRS